MDARKEGGAIIAVAGDVETSLMDTAAIEELNPDKFFEAASLYTGRLVNPEQARRSSIPRFSLPSWKRAPRSFPFRATSRPRMRPARTLDPNLAFRATPVFRPCETRTSISWRSMIDGAKTVAIFGGDGCRNARDEVVSLAGKTEGAGLLFVPRQAVVGT